MAKFHAITNVVTFITKYVTKITKKFVTIHNKCVINRTSVTFGETGGVFKKSSKRVQKFKKSSKKVKKFRVWKLAVNLIHIFFIS